MELMHCKDDYPFDEIIKTMPHIAFEVHNFKKAINSFKLLGKTNCPMEEVKVAMIKLDGVPIELVEIKK